jgi:hypothetical protein
MLKFRIGFFITIWLIAFTSARGQTDYVIKFKLNGLQDTTCLVAYYYSNSTYVKDTLKVDGSGRCNYKAPSNLPKGLYVLVVSDKIY